MIIRYGGGNDGIKDYLENGRKVDRHFSRDELDKRVPIEGDLNVTNAVINAIEDHGQERYLHISMSFNEPDITEEKMAEVFQQYKRELMTAYGDDEYNIYAEIHWPKIKESYNHQTEQMEPRYPHLHIVVPKRNLLTGGFLDPCSMQQRSLKYFDAIQEKLNRDNGLSSPRESPRVGNNHYEAALGRYKDKEFRSKNGELKRDIYNAILERDVKTIDDFQSLLSEFGEVKTRNLGKANQYFAVRLPDDQKFTNLKANIFDKAFIEKRALVIDPITDAQVSKRVNTWREIRSKEIKFISNASPKTKDHYKSLSLPERRAYLAQREADYEQGYRRQTGRDQSEKRRASKQTKLSSLLAGDYEPGDFEFGRGTPAEGEGDLYELRQSSMGHFGGADSTSDQLFLSGDEAGDVQHLQAEGDSGLRHNLYSGSGSGSGSRAITDTTNPQSSVLGALIAAEVEERLKDNDLQRFADIRKNLDPNHLLAYTQIKFGVDPEKHPISKARDGSPRIKVGKTNLNVSDFLTKHIGLEWSEASVILTELYDKQQRGIVEKPKSKIAHIDDWRRFRDQIYPKNIRTYDELKNQIKVSYSLGLKSINSEYFARRKQITSDTRLSRTDKHYFRSVVILEKLQKVESLQNRIKEQDSFTNSVKYPYSTLFYDFATKNEEISMKVLDDLKRRFNPPAPDSENSIGAPTPRTPNFMPSGAEAAKRARLIASLKNQERELKALKIRVADLRPTTLATGAVAFHHKDHGKQIFVNHPDRVELNRAADQDEVAVGMIYAIERFGSPLDIKGTREFKEHIITVAAERDMDITFTDEALNQALQAKRLELGLEPLQSNEITVPELQLDPTMSKEQAVDKALLDSKVAELDAINQAFIVAPDVGMDRDLRQASVTDAIQRHDEIQSGFADDVRIEQIAQADLQAWTFLEGKPEQQQLALTVGAAMQRDAGYSAEILKSAPAEFKLTLDAAQFMAGRDADFASSSAAPTVGEPQAERLPTNDMSTIRGLAETLRLREVAYTEVLRQMRTDGTSQDQIDYIETNLASVQVERAQAQLQFLPQQRQEEQDAGALSSRLDELDTMIRDAQAIVDNDRESLADAARPEPASPTGERLQAGPADLDAEEREITAILQAAESELNDFQPDRTDEETARLEGIVQENTARLEQIAAARERAPEEIAQAAPAAQAEPTAQIADQPTAVDSGPQVRFLRPDMVTALDQERRMSEEYTRIDRQPENFTNWPDAVGTAARLHNDFDMKPRDPNYVDNLAAIDIEAWQFASRDQGGPQELFGQDKAFHLNALVQDIAELADNDPQFRAYMDAYAPSELRNEIRQQTQWQQEQAAAEREDLEADETLLDSQIQQPPTDVEDVTVERSGSMMPGMPDFIHNGEPATLDLSRYTQSGPAPVPEAWRGEACAIFDEEMGARMGEPDYFKAQAVSRLVSQYEEMRFEPSEREQALLVERKPEIDKARAWIRENVLLNPLIKERMYETVRDLGSEVGDPVQDKEHRDYLAEMEATLQLEDTQAPDSLVAEPSVMPAMPEFTHNGEPAILDLSRFQPQPANVVLIEETSGRQWNGETFEFGDLEEAQRFTPMDGLNKAFELAHIQEGSPDKSPIEIHRYDPALDESYRVTSTDNATAWPVAERAFKTGLSVDLDRSDFLAARDGAAERVQGAESKQTDSIHLTRRGESISFNLDQADVRLANLSPEVASKVVELEAVNSKYEDAAMTNAGAVDSIVTKGTVIEATVRHEMLGAGHNDPDQVEDVAKQDLADFAFLQGKPEQQDLARSMATMMGDPGYRDYMRENAPQDVHVTMEASQFVAEQTQAAEMASPENAKDKDLEM